MVLCPLDKADRLGYRLPVAADLVGLAAQAGAVSRRPCAFAIGKILNIARQRVARGA